MAENSLNLTELDFDLLKNSLKSYLQNQEIFQDYDFEGSNLNVLLDLLSYNTSKNVFYMNMLFSESFLDSAQLRDSILSRSKELNYTPRSARSAKATLTASFQATGESQPYVIQKGHSFSSLIKNQSFVFSIPESIIVSSANTSFSFTTDVYEGIYLKDSYVFQTNVENQRFRISNKNVDTTSLTVVVYEDGDVVGDTYRLSQTLLDVTASSKVYFLQASENGYYEIYFGDNVIGRRPKNNALIVLDYRISNATLPNRASNFTINFDPTFNSELSSAVSITTDAIADGGAEPESLESIRYYAPRHFQVQQRAAIPSDYEIILKEEFPEINAVSAYGGEDANPPRYGKVFVAVDVTDVNGIPDNKKDEYKKFLQKRTMLDPIIIEPDFTYLRIDSIVRYNINLTKLSAESIKAIVMTAITNYNTDNLNDFAVQFRYSDFITTIDDSDTSIISNITDIYLYKKLNPLLNSNQNFELNFGVALKEQDEDRFTLSSSYFTYNGEKCFIGNEGNLLHIYQLDDSQSPILRIGSIDYSTGKAIISNLNISQYDGSEIRIYASPKDRDIIIPNDTICQIESDEIILTIQNLSL